MHALVQVDQLQLRIPRHTGDGDGGRDGLHAASVLRQSYGSTWCPLGYMYADDMFEERTAGLPWQYDLTIRLLCQTWTGCRCIILRTPLSNTGVPSSHTHNDGRLGREGAHDLDYRQVNINGVALAHQ